MKKENETEAALKERRSGFYLGYLLVKMLVQLPSYVTIFSSPIIKLQRVLLFFG